MSPRHTPGSQQAQTPTALVVLERHPHNKDAVWPTHASEARVTTGQGLPQTTQQVDIWSTERLLGGVLTVSAVDGMLGAAQCV